MKTWTTPMIEELEIRLTAKKADQHHCEQHYNGKGHVEFCNPECEGWNDDGAIVS